MSGRELLKSAFNISVSEGCKINYGLNVFLSTKYRVIKGFKLHTQPQTGAYSCYQSGLSVICGLRHDEPV